MSNRGFSITKTIRTERRKAADLRNEEYNKLSTQEKLNRLPANGAVKQRARLEAASNKPAKVEVVTK